MTKIAKLMTVWLVSFMIVTVNLNAGDGPAPLGKLVDVGGYRIHLYCTGAGNPTVVVVGGGFSFDWGLIQPKVASLTQICTYDPSGTAWSDPFPLPKAPNCSDRVTEIHEVLRRASIRGPFVIVGFSIGALYGRLYASRYPDDVAGLAIIDHAFNPDGNARPPAETRVESNTPPAHAPEVLPLSQVDTSPSLISQTPIVLGIEDDRNFQRLPKLNRDLHTWAMSKHPIRPGADTVAECAEEIDKQTKTASYPLGTIPVVVLSTATDSTEYQRLQAGLLVLSHRAKQIIAEHSTPMVIVDAPETIVTAIQDMVVSIRDHSTLRK